MMGEVLQSEPTLRFYEYEEFKPPLDDVFLEHHGVLEMSDEEICHFNHNHDPRTGQFTSGPGGGGGGGLIARHKKKKSRKRKIKALKKARKVRSEKLKEQARQKRTKEDIIKSKDIVAMYRYMDKFTNDEIKSVLNRLDTENKLRTAVEERKKASKKIFDIVKENAKKGAKSTLATVSENASKKALKESAKKILGPEAEELIEELFREKKK